MKNKLDQTTGFFAMGEIATASHFREGFQMARSLPNDFPVLTASLEHPNYVALLAALNAHGPVSFTSQLVQHPLATLRHLTLRTSGLHVHWLSEPNATEVCSAMQTWSNGGKSAVALFLPDGAPCNCFFIAPHNSLSVQTETSQLHEAQPTTLGAHDLMTAIVAVGNGLKSKNTSGKRASSPRHLVTVLLTSSIAEHLSDTGSFASALLTSRGTNVLH